MANISENSILSSSSPENRWSSLIALGLYLAIFKLLLHFATNSSYGYFRDELYFLACGEHLAWGYPDHAPLIAFTAKLSRTLFGDSLFAIRLFSALAGATKVFLTALLVKEFGGGRFAVILSSLCVIFAPVYLAIDNLLAMNTFEPVFWMTCVYFAVLAIKHENSKYWFWFGVFAGLGVMNKHSMLFFGLAIVAGLLLTSARRVFLDKWFWIGGAMAFLIFLPNIIWEQQNNWATLELLQNVQKSGKNVVLSPLGFVAQQIFTLLPVTALVWVAGLWYFLGDQRGKQFRFLGFAYLVTLALMIFLKAKDYYLVPIYPMLFAAGGVWWENFTEKRRSTRFLRFALPAVMVGLGIVAVPLVLPVLPIESFVKYQESLGIKPLKAEVSFDSILPQTYADQFGWPEMVAKVAEVYHSLPIEERASTAIYASNYGQAGAIDFFGEKYSLPKSISPHQSYFLWGPRQYTGETMILLGANRAEAEKYCQSVEEKMEVGHRYSMSYEKYKILVCRQTKKPLPEIWHSLKYWN